VIKAAKTLKIIGVKKAGYDNIDIPPRRPPASSSPTRRGEPRRGGDAPTLSRRWPADR
jgi:hypothetical protein